MGRHKVAKHGNGPLELLKFCVRWDSQELKQVRYFLNPRTPSLLLPAWHWYCLACNEKNEKVLFFCHRGKQRIWIVRFFRDLDTNHISWPNLILCSKGKTTTCHLLALDSIRSFFRPNFFEGRCYFKSKCYVLQETAGEFVFYPRPGCSSTSSLRVICFWITSVEAEHLWKNSCKWASELWQVTVITIECTHMNTRNNCVLQSRPT